MDKREWALRCLGCVDILRRMLVCMGHKVWRGRVVKLVVRSVTILILRMTVFKFRMRIERQVDERVKRNVILDVRGNHQGVWQQMEE